MDELARDYIGQVIKVGDILAYGMREGNTGAINLYEVVDLQPLSDDERRYNRRQTHKAKAVEYKASPWLDPDHFVKHDRTVWLKMLRTQAVKTQLRAVKDAEGHIDFEVVNE